MASKTKTKKGFFEIDEVTSIIGNIAIGVVCLAFILPVFFKNIHAGYQYILICVGCMLVSIFTVFLNAKQSRPAVRIIPLLCFYDIVIYITLFVANIIKVKSVTTFATFIRLFHLSHFFELPGAVPVCIITAIVFVVLSLYSFANKRSDSFVSVLIILESIVLSLVYVWRNSKNSEYGRVVLSVSILAAFVWLFICTYSNVVLKGERRNTSFHSLILAITILFFNFFCANNTIKGLNVFFIVPETITDAIARKMYPWWLAILLTIVFIVVGIILAAFADGADEDDVRGYVDAKFFFAAAVLSLLSKLILSNYFAYSIVLYIVVLIVLHADIRKDVSRIEKKDKNDRYYDVEDFVLRSLRLLYIAICFIFIIQIAENMLYLTLPIALIIMYMLYKLTNNFFKKEILEDEKVKSVHDGLPKSYHYTVALMSALLTASLVYHYRFSVSNLVLLTILVITILFVFISLKRKLPNNVKLPEINTVKWLTVIFAVVVCIVLTSSSGAKLKMEYDAAKRTTEVVATTNRKSTIKKIEYKWDNGLIYDGYELLVADVEPFDFEVKSQNIKGQQREFRMMLPVQGENLTVWITDSNGVKTTRTLWFPTWYDNRF